MRRLPRGSRGLQEGVFGGGIGCGSIFHSFGVEILPKWQFLRNGSKPFSRGFSSPVSWFSPPVLKPFLFRTTSTATKKENIYLIRVIAANSFFTSTHEFRIKCSLSLVTYYYLKIIFAAVYIYGGFFRMSLEISAVREIHFWYIFMIYGRRTRSNT